MPQSMVRHMQRFKFTGGVPAKSKFASPPDCVAVALTAADGDEPACELRAKHL